MKYKVKGEIYILLKEIVEGLQKGNFNSDPFGYCTQLFFLLENRLETNHLDALSDWMNSFIHEVLIEGKISRSADNEITSAILGSYILQKHERLTVEVDYKKVNELLKQHCDDKGYYFRKNLTYTICLALGLFDHKANIDCWETTRKSLQEEYKNGNLQCDSKNLCYYTLLMEKEDNKKILEEIAKSTVDILIKNGTNTYDKAYYLWVAWHNKRFIKKELKLIKDKLANSLENFVLQVETEDGPQSRIITSLYYDLAKSFFGSTVLISLDEYKEPNIFAKIGGFCVGMALIVLMVFLIYLSAKNGWLSYANYKLVSLKAVQEFIYTSLKFLFSILLLPLEVYLGWVGLLIGYEVGIKDRYQRQELGFVLKKWTLTYWKSALVIIAGQIFITPMV